MNQFNQAMDIIHTKVADARGKWMDALMYRLLPKSVYGDIHSGSKAQIRSAIAFMLSNQIKLQDYCDKSTIVHGGRKIGEFMVAFNPKPQIITRHAKKIARLPEPMP